MRLERIQAAWPMASQLVGSPFFWVLFALVMARAFWMGDPANDIHVNWSRGNVFLLLFALCALSPIWRLQRFLRGVRVSQTTALRIVALCVGVCLISQVGILSAFLGGRAVATPLSVREQVCREFLPRGETPPADTPYWLILNANDRLLCTPAAMEASSRSDLLDAENPYNPDTSSLLSHQVADSRYGIPRQRFEMWIRAKHAHRPLGWRLPSFSWWIWHGMAATAWTAMFCVLFLLKARRHERSSVRHVFCEASVIAVPIVTVLAPMFVRDLEFILYLNLSVCIFHTFAAWLLATRHPSTAATCLAAAVVNAGVILPLLATAWLWPEHHMIHAEIPGSVVLVFALANIAPWLAVPLAVRLQD